MKTALLIVTLAGIIVLAVYFAVTRTQEIRRPGNGFNGPTGAPSVKGPTEPPPH